MSGLTGLTMCAVMHGRPPKDQQERHQADPEADVGMAGEGEHESRDDGHHAKDPHRPSRPSPVDRCHAVRVELGAVEEAEPFFAILGLASAHASTGGAIGADEPSTGPANPA